MARKKASRAKPTPRASCNSFRGAYLLPSTRLHVRGGHTRCRAALLQGEGKAHAGQRASDSLYRGAGLTPAAWDRTRGVTDVRPHASEQAQVPEGLTDYALR